MKDLEIRKRCVAIYKTLRFRRDVLKDNREVVMDEFLAETKELKKEIETNQMNLNIPISHAGDDLQVSPDLMKAA